MFTNLRRTACKDVDRNGKPLQADITQLAVNAAGTRVINTRADKSIRVWKAAPTFADPVVIDNAHAKPTRRVCWVPRADTTFASVGGDAFVKIWRCTGTLEREIKVARGKTPVRCVLVEFSPDGAVMAVVLDDGTLMFYGDNYTLMLLVTAAAPVNDVKWTNTGHTFVMAALENGCVDVYRLDKGTALLQHTLARHTLAVTCLAVDPTGRYIAAGTRGGVVSLWRTLDLVNYGAVTGVDQAVAALACSPDGRYVAVAFARECTTKIFDVASMAEVYDVAGSGDGLAVAWFANKPIFVTTGDKGRVMEYTRREPPRARPM